MTNNKVKKWKINSGDKHYDNLLNATISYINKMGGKVMVIGGVSYQQRGGKYNYSLIIDYTGTPPIKPPTQ